MIFPKYQILNTKSSRGFTLIELLVVVAILGILATIGLANFRTSQIKARDATRKSDLKQIQTAVEVIYNDYGRYPSSDDNGRILACPYVPPPGTGTACTWGSTGGIFDTEGADKKTIYLKIVPQDPTGNTYIYESNGTKFRILTRLENLKDKDLVESLEEDCGTFSCNFGLASPNHLLQDSIE